MNITRESNLRNVSVMALVSVFLFGIFYYLITDVSNSTNLKAEKKVSPQVTEQSFVFDVPVEAEVKPQEVKGDSIQKSVFKELSAQKMDVQPKMVLAGESATTLQSTVPATGSDAIFSMFVVSSLIMFAGIYLLLTQPGNAALVKFEKRVIRELD